MTNELTINSQTPMPRGSWGDANEEASSSARSACEHLELAIQIMTEPNDGTLGASILESLKDAQESLLSAIKHYPQSRNGQHAIIKP